MTPRPAPDLDARRTRLTRTARTVAEAEGWAAVTMRRLAAELGVTQPVLYSAVSSRQALLDAVALEGFSELADVLEAVEAAPLARMRTYLAFAEEHPRLYEAMFSMPTELPYAAEEAPAPLRRAFAGLGDAFPDGDDTRTEVAWAALHGLATLRAAGRLTPGQEQARLDLAHRSLTPTPQEDPS